MHPESELIAYVTDELPAAERARVAAHVEQCAQCRREVAESRAVLAGLAAGAPVPPPVDWGRYGADLRARLPAGRRRARWARPVPAIIAAGVATASLLLAVHGLQRSGDLPAADETMLAARLPLLQEYRVVERLDLLEDLDAIRDLDRAGGGER